MTDDQRDPVESGLGDRYDLYDVATWEVRGRLDSFAVRLTESLRTARTWTLILLATLLFLVQVAIGGLLVLEQPVLGGLALVSIAPALALAGYFWYGDPTRREPLEPLAITFILSILFASFAAVVNSLLSPITVIPASLGLPAVLGFPLFFFIVVAPIEEFVKWLSIRVHAYKTETFDAVIDGVVYGAIAGLGFAAIENLIYIVNAFTSSASAGMATPISDAIDRAYLRAFVGPGHVIYSAFAGYYLGLAKFNPDNRGPIVVKGLVIAAFIHGLYNSLTTVLPLESTLAVAGFIIVYDGFWFAILYRKVSRYKSLYREAQDTAPAAPEDAQRGPSTSEFDPTTGRDHSEDDAVPHATEETSDTELDAEPDDDPQYRKEEEADDDR
jgi:RsiW-degrading membrane proteinase PrsW (M82 family)